MLMYVEIRGQPSVSSTLSFETVSHWLELHQVGSSGWPVSSRGLYLSQLFWYYRRTPAPLVFHTGSRDQTQIHALAKPTLC